MIHKETKQDRRNKKVFKPSMVIAFKYITSDFGNVMKWVGPSKEKPGEGESEEIR